jgi:hypothetical protein
VASVARLVRIHDAEIRVPDVDAATEAPHDNGVRMGFGMDHAENRPGFLSFVSEYGFVGCENSIIWQLELLE